MDKKTRWNKVILSMIIIICIGLIRLSGCSEQVKTADEVKIGSIAVF